MGIVNVDQMLDSISHRQLLEWRAYEDLEVFDSERADYHSAQVAQALWNIARDVKRNPNGWPLTDFLLTFGDTPRIERKQSLETQEFLIDAWIAGSNAIFEAKKQCPSATSA